MLLLSLVLLLITLSPFAEASHLVVLLENVPYNANFTLLCYEVVDLYYNLTSTTLANYCNSSMELRYNHMEVVEVSFLNATEVTVVNLDYYPLELNTRLEEGGFFQHWEGGKVKLVADHIELTVTVLVVLGSFILVTIAYMCMLTYLTTCPRTRFDQQYGRLPQ